jgi:hypothetical protein
MGVANKLSDNFYELPISNLTIAGRILPWGGGAYFRLIPYPLFRCGVQKVLKRDEAYVFYMHPWEIDSEQPIVNQASFNYSFRHYTNLHKTLSKLKSLTESFDYCRFVSCVGYLNLTTDLGLRG